PGAPRPLGSSPCRRSRSARSRRRAARGRIQRAPPFPTRSGAPAGEKPSLLPSPDGEIAIKGWDRDSETVPLRAKSEGRLGTWKEARLLDDPCHDPVPADGHQVHASDPIDFPKGL